MDRGKHRYCAFISYRHEPIGRKWAVWLHRAIEGYRVPSALVKSGRASPRVGRVFRDEEELSASADLSWEIDQALMDSKFLIVVCTPRTPHSRWVNREIARFRELGRGDRILALLVEGEPHESFPEALLEIRPHPPSDRSSAAPDALEPLAADVREEVRVQSGHGTAHVRSHAKLRLIAALLGVRFDELKNRELRRTQARSALFTSASAAVAVVCAGVAAYAFRLRADALEQQQIAQGRAVELQVQKNDAERKRDAAEISRMDAEAVTAFVTNGILGRGDERNRIRNPREFVENVINPAAVEIDRKHAESSAREIPIRVALALVYRSVGAAETGLPHARRAVQLCESYLSPDDPNAYRAIETYASLLRARRVNKPIEAEALLRATLEARRRTQGADHPDTLMSAMHYATLLLDLNRHAAAEPVLADAVTRAATNQRLGLDDALVRESAGRWSECLRRLNRVAEADAVRLKYLPSRQATTRQVRRSTSRPM